ncbi:MarR family transcriptional regulator [Streptomyces canus]|uniref:MarR family transcriptional regulator n=1 Tax=Streptomyces canus TaxID=58343 RepID=A0A124I0P3_9ACTN|nr:MULTISPECIES: MarR family transcriptional regulator [Streptomyces]KUN74444.1 MarR family transcriptional regulator [Streptomyces canus]MDI5912233.1 MarR family transcriptional regulator [Streptomyces sp. 12257]
MNLLTEWERIVEAPVEDDLCTRIRRSEQALMAHHEAVLRTYGLTMTQYTVLLFLSRQGDLSGAQLARRCGVTQQSMSSVLTNMEGKELIRREASPVHAKVQIATLTDMGQAVLERAYQEVIVLERALTDAFTPSEHTALCELLERATTVLVQQTRQATGPSIA